MPTDLHAGRPAPRRPSLDGFRSREHRAYIDMAFAADDPRLLSQAIKEVATLRRVPCALDDNPPLGEVMRALRDLGLGLVVRHLDAYGSDLRAALLDAIADEGRGCFTSAHTLKG